MINFAFMKSKNKIFPFDIAKILQEWAQKDALQIIGHEVLLIMHRPYSIVFKISVHYKNMPSANIFLKYYTNYFQMSEKQGLIKRDFQTTKFWYEQFKGNKKYKVVKALYYDPEKYILITEESKGINLGEYLNRHGQFFPSQNLQKKVNNMIFGIGGWLKFFQSIPINKEPEQLSLGFINDYISIRLERLVENTKVDFSQQLSDRILNYLEECWKEVKPDDLQSTYVHTDLSLSNVLISSESITVLDFNRKEVGSPYKDLTRFYHQLFLLKNKPTFQKSFIKNLQKNFLNGYGDSAIDKHPLFRIFLMTHIINHLGKTARYWEHSAIENLYNRWIVRNALLKIKSMV